MPVQVCVELRDLGQRKRLRTRVATVRPMPIHTPAQGRRPPVAKTWAKTPAGMNAATKESRLCLRAQITVIYFTTERVLS